MMEEQKQYGLSMVRFIAMISIILCHIMQNLGNISCYYLNVGVWLFLFISGFLYGKKDISNVTVFYKKRLVRILVPYYIMLGVIILVNLLQGDSITAKELISSILCLQWYGKTVPNCGHLWYISCILFCYLITPILQWICEQNENKSLIKKCMLLVLAVLMLQVIYSLGGMKQATTSILPYILGYFMSFNKITLNSRGGGYSTVILVISLGLYCVMYVFEALGYFAIPGILLDYYKSIVATAITMFFVQYSFENSFIREIFDFSDKYSYGIYLTHHIFILGSLSVMSLTPCWWINVTIPFLIATITGMVLIWSSDKITVLLRKRG